MLLREIQIIDMKKSVIDKDKSDLERGQVVFTKRVPIPKKMRDQEYYFKWGREPIPGVDKTTENTAGLWMIRYGASYVTKDDPYWPEGVPLDEKGHYKIPNGDAVLMKFPLAKYVEKVKADRAKADKQLAAKFREYDKKVGNKPKDNETYADMLGL